MYDDGMTAADWRMVNKVTKGIHVPKTGYGPTRAKCKYCGEEFEYKRKVGKRKLCDRCSDFSQTIKNTFGYFKTKKEFIEYAVLKQKQNNLSGIECEKLLDICKKYDLPTRGIHPSFDFISTKKKYNVQDDYDPDFDDVEVKTTKMDKEYDDTFKTHMPSLDLIAYNKTKKLRYEEERKRREKKKLKKAKVDNDVPAEASPGELAMMFKTSDKSDKGINYHIHSHIFGHLFRLHMNDSYGDDLCVVNGKSELKGMHRKIFIATDIIIPSRFSFKSKDYVSSIILLSLLGFLNKTDLFHVFKIDPNIKIIFANKIGGTFDISDINNDYGIKILEANLLTSKQKHPLPTTLFDKTDDGFIKFSDEFINFYSKYLTNEYTNPTWDKMVGHSYKTTYEKIRTLLV